MADSERRPLYVGEPNLPDWQRFEEMFRGIFERRFFANHGPLERELDGALAEYLGVSHAISVVNGTVALMLAAKALDMRGEVIVPSFTFAATAQALNWAGLTPVFCDVEPDTHNLSARLVEPLITERTAGILGVHLWGRACDPDGLERLAQERGLKLFFDAAHAIGCSHKGKRIGGFGSAEIFSFHATKILNGAEGGCITTNDDELAARLRTMRTFHDSETRVPVALRINAKISEAQAAMALLSLEHLPENIQANRMRYFRYRELLSRIDSVAFVDHAGNEASNYQYVVIKIDRAHVSCDEILRALVEKNIHARDYFSPGVHHMAPYRDVPQPDLPVTDELSASLIQLPTGPSVTDADLVRVCDSLEEIVEEAGRA